MKSLITAVALSAVCLLSAGCSSHNTYNGGMYGYHPAHGFVFVGRR